MYLILYKFVKNLILKKYWIQYKPFLLFLGKFAAAYLILILLYQGYLNQFDSKAFQVDGFTKLVAEQTKQTILFLNGNAQTEVNSSESSVKFFFNQKYVARIIEGCNALSVIILFIAFIVAFTGKLKHTILFGISGSVLIHILNVARIALLSAAIFYFPEQEEILHVVIFPLFIYGVVFILWVIWVNKYSLYAKKVTKS